MTIIVPTPVSCPEYTEIIFSLSSGSGFTCSSSIMEVLVSVTPFPYLNNSIYLNVVEGYQYDGFACTGSAVSVYENLFPSAIMDVGFAGYVFCLSSNTSYSPLSTQIITVTLSWTDNGGGLVTLASGDYFYIGTNTYRVTFANC